MPIEFAAKKSRHSVTNTSSARGVVVNMNALDVSTDSDLLRDYEKRGAQTAFSALVERYQAMVVGTAFRKTGNLEIARDVAQEVFAALAKKAGILIGRASIGGWLHQAAVYESLRTIQSERRRTNRHDRYADDAEKVAEPEVGGAAGPARLAVLDEAIDVLPTADREVLVLHYFQDLSYAEMAAALDTNEPAVRKRVSRALERLGTRLRERNVGGDLASLLAGGVAIQASLPFIPGLADSALAAAVAGAGSSGFLTLTAIMSHATVKLAAAIVALAAIPVAWQLAGLDSSSTPVASAVPVSAEGDRVRVRAPLRDPANASPAVLAARNRLRTSVADTAKVRRPPAEVATTDLSRTAAIPAATAATAAIKNPATVVPGATGPAPPDIPLSPSEIATAAASPISAAAAVAPEIPTVSSDLLAVIGDIGFDGVPATPERLRSLELEPKKIAALYTDLLGQVLDLNPLQTGRVEDFLQDHFDRLNLKGLAGPRPLAIPELDYILSRQPAVNAVVEGIQAVIPEVLPEPKLLETIFHLPDEPIPAGKPVAIPVKTPDILEKVPAILPLPRLPLSH